MPSLRGEQDATGAAADVDLTIDFLFMADMVFNFFTGYFNDSGLYVDRLPTIASTYLRSWFFLDFVSSVPFDFFVGLALSGGTNTLRSFQLIRILRLIRLLKLFRLVRLSRYMTKVSVLSCPVSLLAVITHTHAHTPPRLTTTSTSRPFTSCL